MMPGLPTKSLYWGYTGNNGEMETSILGYIGTMEKKMETTTVYRIMQWFYIPKSTLQISVLSEDLTGATRL